MRTQNVLKVNHFLFGIGIQLQQIFAVCKFRYTCRHVIPTCISSKQHNQATFEPKR